MEQRGRRLTDAFVAALELRKHLREGTAFCDALTVLKLQIETLEDDYPEWHPAPYSFHGMLKLFVYLEVTGDSYRSLTRHPELADVFGLGQIPNESVISRTWRNRFDDDVRRYITASAHCLVKEIHNQGLSVPEVRPLEEVKQSSEETTDSAEDATEFSDEEIYRTTRLAREHGFGPFDSERAQNATYEDTRFFELQTFIGMVGCGTPQGAARFKFRRGKEYGPHGDTHLRAVKQFDPESLLKGFQQATERLLSVIQSESSFRRPVTVAIDITTIRYFGNIEGMPMVSGTKDGEGRAFKFATLSIVGWNIPLILAVEPVRESSSWDENPPNRVHRVVRRLVRRAQEHVPIEMVLCDREFDSKAVYQTLSNLDVNYLIPKRIHSAERENIETMDEDEQEVAVESASVHVEQGSHSMQFLYVPSTKSDGTAVFATNLRVSADEAQAVCRRYSSRWQIENEYKSIKNDFLAKTSSKDYRVRLFYFVFAVLLHNIWRLTDFLLKIGVGGEMEYAPVLTAGECVELVCSALLPPD
ncbi:MULTISPECIES: transposase [Haloferax]|uniref:Transposase DDE domain protein n=1 Tax=Haloferax massiliensis TaxID=1476858 RepID=A0A0D6JWJ0_9EURY|nr:MULTISPECIES: transposase [Haloferax]MDS0241398.1 transposase [Haloferax sp. S2CR25]MDS0241739.1 transposase [Haloferax sp. S2CR25]MDS0444519.1 transposase [Haloferax sp. S2CR25-2]MDS0444860.1 transposase [Haloferax sp. S2CR25-2]CQR53042.1 Transposase DDE domain protein [Haloferax massiliensis]